MTARELFLANLDTIGRIVEFVSARHKLSADVREEFESYTRVRLMEDDYRALRSFRGDSQIATYLSVVIQRCFVDFRHEEWGRWRSSAAAKRLGLVAMRLERLVYRDRHSFDEAVKILLGTYKVSATESELEAIYLELPARDDHFVFGEDVLCAVDPAVPAADPEDLDRRRSGSRLEEALRSALATLSPRDRLILRMRFVDGFSIVSIARTLGLDATRLYPRVQKIFRRLRKRLREQGVRRSEVLSILRSHHRIDLDFGEKVEKSEPGPSKVTTES